MFMYPGNCTFTHTHHHHHTTRDEHLFFVLFCWEKVFLFNPCSSWTCSNPPASTCLMVIVQVRATVHSCPWFCALLFSIYFLESPQSWGDWFLLPVVTNIVLFPMFQGQWTLMNFIFPASWFIIFTLIYCYVHCQHTITLFKNLFSFVCLLIYLISMGVLLTCLSVYHIFA